MKRPLKWLLSVVIVVAVLLGLIRFVGSPFATHFANRKLEHMPQFAGHVDAVQLALWRGTISVRNLRLQDRAHPEDGDIVIVPHGMVSVAWAPIFHGRIGGDASVERGEVVMVKRADPDKDEKEKKEKKRSKPLVRSWQDILGKEFPVELHKLELKECKLRFDDRSEPQVVSFAIDAINLTVEGFSNRQKRTEALPATLRMRARAGGTGEMVVDAKADPADRQPRFEAKFEIKGLQLVPIHDFLARYALIDVRSGEFELYSEVTAANGSYDGYTKPFFKNLKFEAVPDPNKNLLQRAAAKVAAAMQDALKNEKGDVATKAPFHGDFEDNKLDVWATLENLLRNAFIQALGEGLEGQTATPAGK